MQQIIDDYLEYLKGERGLRKSTRQTYARHLEEFNIFIQVPDPSQITGSHVNLYRQFITQKLANGNLPEQNTIRNKLTVARGFTKWYSRTHRCIDAFQGVKLPKEIITDPYVPSQQDVQRIIWAADYDSDRGRRNAAMAVILAATGVRRSELVTLKMGHVSQGRGDDFLMLHVPGIKGQPRQVPFGDFSMIGDLVGTTFLEWWGRRRMGGRIPDGGPLFPAWDIDGNERHMCVWNVRDIVRKLAADSGIDDWRRITPHTFRHFFATFAVYEGINIVHLTKLMGHCSADTTMRYVHLANLRKGSIAKEHSPLKGLQAVAQVQSWTKVARIKV